MHSKEMFNPEHTVKIILIKGNDLVNTGQVRRKKISNDYREKYYNILERTQSLFLLYKTQRVK